MLSFAAGLLPVPLFKAWNAASVENGFDRRPQPATTQDAALLLMNQIMPLMGMLTVAVSVPPPSSRAIVYLNVSVPSNPAGGLYVNLPIVPPVTLITTVPPFADA